MDHGQQPATTTEWHYFKDLKPTELDRPITVYWEFDGIESPTCRIAHDYEFLDGKLYDAEYNEVDLDITGENVVWSYWPVIDIDKSTASIEQQNKKRFSE